MTDYLERNDIIITYIDNEKRWGKHGQNCDIVLWSIEKDDLGRS